MASNAVKLDVPEKPNVYQRLNAAREAFHSLQLKKTGKNTFAGYQYFELADFLIPALKVFHEHGLCATISFDQDFARMRIVSVDDGSQIEITSPMGSAALKGCHEVQNIGAVETYQRRYLWVAALEIVEHDALDATAGKDGGQAPDPVITDAQYAELATLVEQTNTDLAKFCKFYRCDALVHLPAARFGHAKAALLKKLPSDREAA